LTQNVQDVECWKTPKKKNDYVGMSMHLPYCFIMLLIIRNGQ